jgi:ComF family protein
MLKTTLTKTRTFFRKNLSGLSALFYPSKCIICYTDLPEKIDFICPSCEDGFHRTYFEKYEKNNPASVLFWGRAEMEHVFCYLYFKESNSTRSIIHQIKYKEGQLIAAYMGEKMGLLLSSEEKYQDIDALVPIPLHDKKEFIRGYNQSLEICKGLSASLNVPTAELLIRKRHHDSQTKKNRFERYDNVKDIFDVPTGRKQFYNHIALVDDVLTTGSTIESAYRTLKLFFPEIKISVITIGFAGK